MVVGDAVEAGFEESVPAQAANPKVNSATKSSLCTISSVFQVPCASDRDREEAADPTGLAQRADPRELRIERADQDRLDDTRLGIGVVLHRRPILLCESVLRRCVQVAICIVATQPVAEYQMADNL